METGSRFQVTDFPNPILDSALGLSLLPLSLPLLRELTHQHMCEIVVVENKDSKC